VLDGICYVTEDRKVEGFFETMSIAENLQMGELASREATRSFVLRMAEMQALADWTGA
jgi:simple sugar transport system ATP-binding protein